MGSWVIKISGHGIHHNGRQDDAETMAAVFVGELKAAGHDVNSAWLVLDGESEDDLQDRSTNLLPLAPAVESESFRVTGETDSGQRVYMREPPVHYPHGLDDPRSYAG